MYYCLLVFILINSGLSIGISRAKLTEPLRNKIKEKSTWWGGLVNCVMCMGFYTSIPVYIYVYKSIDLNIVAWMFIGSITSYLINSISNTIRLS